MVSFLRYNSRHSLFFPRGYEGKHLPQLNPISSCSHNAKGQRTWRVYEPLWLFKLRQRVFCHAGKQRCGRRGESHFGLRDGGKEFPDTWDLGPDGFRTCSYCGSLHYDDFIEICRRATKDAAYMVEPSDKRYKVYVRQPEVRNASEGGIKFYMQHAPVKVSDADNKVFQEAVKLSNQRFQDMMNKMREGYRAKV